jgi:D-sedoheptulose 7-phosphate isomerase
MARTETESENRSTTLTLEQVVLDNIAGSIAVKQSLMEDAALLDLCVRSAELLARTLRAGRRAFLMGNGGSAADAQHIAAELVGRYKMERRGLPVMALTVNSSCLTAIGNDYSYEMVFARQIEALAGRGDVAIGISTSGNSRNVLLALAAARKLGAHTIGLTGLTGGQMRAVCDFCLCMPSEDTPRIQESHILIGHILSDIVEREIFGH